MKRSAASTHKCCYPVCHNNIGLSRSSKLLQYDVLKKFNFFIMDDTRVCTNHSKTEFWENAHNESSLKNFKREQIERVLEILRGEKPCVDKNGNYSFAINRNCFRLHIQLYILIMFVSCFRNRIESDETLQTKHRTFGSPIH